MVSGGFEKRLTQAIFDLERQIQEDFGVTIQIGYELEGVVVVPSVGLDPYSLLVNAKRDLLITNSQKKFQEEFKNLRFHVETSGTPGHVEVATPPMSLTGACNFWYPAPHQQPFVERWKGVASDMKASLSLLPYQEHTFSDYDYTVSAASALQVNISLWDLEGNSLFHTRMGTGVFEANLAMTEVAEGINVVSLETAKWLSGSRGGFSRFGCAGAPKDFSLSMKTHGHQPSVKTRVVGGGLPPLTGEIVPAYIENALPCSDVHPLIATYQTLLGVYQGLSVLAQKAQEAGQSINDFGAQLTPIVRPEHTVATPIHYVVAEASHYGLLSLTRELAAISGLPEMEVMIDAYVTKQHAATKGRSM